MKIHQLWAENVKGISSRVVIDFSHTGLNLVSAPNEMGKTTIAQVLDCIFKYKSDSSAQAVHDLKPKGRDVSPAMGATIEVDGQIYEIEKQWLKGSKTEVKFVSPEIKSLDGEPAQRIIDEIYKKRLDESVWKMIQVDQASFDEILKSKSAGERAALSRFLAQVVSSGSDLDDKSIMERIQEEMADWWQPNKKKLSSAQGKSGSLISEKIDEISSLQELSEDLEKKIASAATIEVEMLEKQESKEVLEKRKLAQDANAELLSALRELKDRNDLQEKIDQLVLETPVIKEISDEIFDSINADHALHAQFVALKSIQLKAISAVELEINGSKIELSSGEVHDQKLESPLNITIPNLLSIDYEDIDAAGLQAGATRYLENLAILGCKDFDSIQPLKRKFSEYQIHTNNLNALINKRSIESLKAIVSDKMKLKETFPNWDEDIVAKPVSNSDLVAVAREVGNKEGRTEQIAINGWHTSLEETQEKILYQQKRLEGLYKKANAVRLLDEVITKHKNAAESDYSSHFSKYLNDLATSFYGTDVHFEVSESFDIISRRLGSTVVPISQLSTGAKEQLAILIRLALTQIVQVGEPFPVILDDEFAHSDADRIAMMNNIFIDFGDEQQFIMLTCTPEKFSSYKPVKTIDLAAMREA